MSFTIDPSSVGFGPGDLDTGLALPSITLNLGHFEGRKSGVIYPTQLIQRAQGPSRTEYIVLDDWLALDIETVQFESRWVPPSDPIIEFKWDYGRLFNINWVWP